MKTIPLRKIVLLGTTANAAIHFRGPLIRALAALGHTVYVFCYDYTPATRAAIEQLGGTSLDSPFKRIDFNPLTTLLASLKFYRQLKSISPDIILSYFATPVILGTLLSKIANVPYRVALLEGLGYAFTHRPDKKNIKNILLKFLQVSLYRFILPLANRIILLNNDDLHELKDKYHFNLADAIVLDSIGVPKNFFQSSVPPIAPITFTFIGRLLYDKGIREFIAAAQLISAENKKVCFKIIGDVDPINPSSLSAKAIAELNLPDNIEFMGYTNDIISAIKSSSIVVLPSYREGFPRVIQEAMALGRAIITTDVPGCRQTLHDTREGFLVPPFSATAIADCMRSFIQHPDKIIEMGRSAALTAQEKYHEYDITPKWIQVLLRA